MQIHACVLCRTSGDDSPGRRGAPAVTEGPCGRDTDAQPSTVNPLRFKDLGMQLRFHCAVSPADFPFPSPPGMTGHLKVLRFTYGRIADIKLALVTPPDAAVPSYRVAH